MTTNQLEWIFTILIAKNTQIPTMLFPSFIRLVIYSLHRFGRLAEWSNAHRWKRCVPQGTGGSNPPSSEFVFYGS